MNLELHRRDDAVDAQVRMVKEYRRWLTAEQYEEIPKTEASVLAEVLIKTLPTETLTELSRLLTEEMARVPD